MYIRKKEREIMVRVISVKIEIFVLLFFFIVTHSLLFSSGKMFLPCVYIS